MSKIPFYFNTIRARAREDGFRAAAREINHIVSRNIASVYYSAVLDDPETIWGDWDVCIVLDACRPDLLTAVTDEYGFLPRQIPTVRSVGSTSTEWIEANFDPEYRRYLRDTAYITGNPYTDQYPELAELSLLDEVWRYAWDVDSGTQPPRPLTDRAITVWREQSPERLIVHYMQPHFPSIPDSLDSKIDLESFGEEWTNSVWDQLAAGELSDERIWEAYLENCRYVLNEVELLLDNLDAARVVITADHGNAFGEWGHYGHPGDSPVPWLQHVPWVETTGTDQGTHVPDTYTSENCVETTVSDRLSALGYRDD